MTELGEKVKGSPSATHQVARTLFTTTLPAVDVGVLGAVLVADGTVGVTGNFAHDWSL